MYQLVNLPKGYLRSTDTQMSLKEDGKSQPRPISEYGVYLAVIESHYIDVLPICTSLICQYSFPTYQHDKLKISGLFKTSSQIQGLFKTSSQIQGLFNTVLYCTVCISYPSRVSSFFSPNWQQQSFPLCLSYQNLQEQEYH